MLENGIYDLNYRADGAGGEDAAGYGLAMLRDGVILGSDRWGGLFDGSCTLDGATGKERLHVRLTVPPEGMLITGFQAGPQGAVVEIEGEVAHGAGEARVSVTVAGAPVTVKLRYLGPLARRERRNRRAASRGQQAA